MPERSRSALRRASTVFAGVAVVLALSGCTPIRAHFASTSTATANAAPNSTERHVIDAINTFRAAHGLPALSVQPNVENKAKLWAAWMTAGNCGRGPTGTPTICHSDLSSGITVHWSLLEENVGAASPATNVAGIINGFQHSTEHAANMLNTRITSVGVGVAYSGNAVFVAEEFMAQ